MKRSDRRLLGKIIKIIFYIYISPILLTVLIIKMIIKNNKKKKLKKSIQENAKIDYIRRSNNEFLIKMQNNEISENNNENKYHIKAKTITDNEKYFLDIIKKHFSKDYDIRVQVPLASIIEKEKDFEGQYQSELNRIIDIGIFDKDTSYPLLLIEINDPTHYRKDRQVRDAKVKNICEQANIKLIAFWTEYSNTEEYVFNRVNENLGR